jgi:UDP-N-acetylmuramyl tripeptide synthase
MMRMGAGQALPGMVLDRLEPGAMARLAAALPGGVVLVTGTNGKTTTTRQIVSGLTAAGERVVTNRSGSNLRRGISAALASGTDQGTLGVFEVDEDTLPGVAAELDPSLVVVLNLFRDQLDRHPDLESVGDRILAGLRDTRADVLLNADDPHVADLGRGLPPERRQYFGIEESAGLGSPTDPAERDHEHCPACGSLLHYTHLVFAQLGHYACPGGDFRRPAPGVRVTLTGTATSDGLPFVVQVDGQRQGMVTRSPGTYNIYNALAALGACAAMGADPAVAGPAISACPPAFGRSELLDLGDRRVQLVLVKNPTGFTEVIRSLLVDHVTAPALIILNDAAADGRDVSWVWDVPMELLAGRPGPVIASGTRAADLQLRLRYAGVVAQISPSNAAAVRELLSSVPRGQTGYVLATYTAMVAARRELVHQGAVSSAEAA